jgi:hypothetical protein
MLASMGQSSPASGSMFMPVNCRCTPTIWLAKLSDQAVPLPSAKLASGRTTGVSVAIGVERSTACLTTGKS